MNTSIRARRAERGFSFIELLVTIIIAGIAFAALVPVFVQGAKAASADKARTLAKSIALDRIEKIRQLPYNLLTENNLTSDATRTATTSYPEWKWAASFGPTAVAKNELGGNKTYDVTYSVVFVGGTDNGKARAETSTSDGTEDYLNVTVSVTWQGNPKPARTVQLHTLIFRQNDGPQVTGLDVLSGTGTGIGPGIDSNGWLTLSTVNNPITFRAVIGPGDAGLVKLVKFRVDGPGGPFLLADGVVDSTVGPIVAYKATWIWTPIPPYKLVVDGSYTVSATAYSSATGYKVYAGNTWSRMLSVEQGDPVACTGVWARGGDHEIMLSWTPSVSQDVAGYDIYRATDSSGSSAVRIGSFSGQVGSQMPPVFIDWGSGGAGPPDGDMSTPAPWTATSYYYWVVARDLLGNPARPTSGLPKTNGVTSISVPTVPVLGTTVAVPDTRPPAIPGSAGLTSAVTNQTIALDWHQEAVDPKSGLTVGGASNGDQGGYLVFRDDLTKPYAMYLFKTTTWSNVGLGWDESHTYTLRAFDGSLNVSSSYYGPTTATTALSPTYNFMLTTTAACTVTVTNWSSRDVLKECPKSMTASNSSFTWVVTPGDYEVKSVSESTTKYQTYSIVAKDLLTAKTGF